MDAISHRYEAPALQRASGQLSVSVKQRDQLSVLDGLRQSGCLKARFPRPDNAGWLNVITLNTSGGIAGGDALSADFAIGKGARATISGQAAERFYRTLPDSKASRVTTRIAVSDAAAAEWLPQETILFDRCAVRRHLRVELAADAWFLGVESLVFGRTAMGEAVERGTLHDHVEVWRDGRPMLRDAIRLDGDIAATLERRAIAQGARAIATLVHVAPDAECALDRIRAASPLCGTSAWDGMLIARFLATDGASLRGAVLPALQVLRGERVLPRLWLC